MTMRDGKEDSEEKLSGEALRSRPIASLRFGRYGDEYSGIAKREFHATRRSNRDLARGYPIERIKRRRRCTSAPFQWYLRGSRRVLSAIGHGVVATGGNAYQFADRGEMRPASIFNDGMGGGGARRIAMGGRIGEASRTDERPRGGNADDIEWNVERT